MNEERKIRRLGILADVVGFVCLIAFFLFLLAMAGMVRVAYAHPDGEPYAEWYRGLQRPDVGGSCCNIQDCKTVSFRQAADGNYEVWIDERFDRKPMGGMGAHDSDPGFHVDNPHWWPVPAEKILSRMDNPTGEAVVCWSPYIGIMCFVRPPET